MSSCRQKKNDASARCRHEDAMHASERARRALERDQTRSDRAVLMVAVELRASTCAAFAFLDIASEKTTPATSPHNAGPRPKKDMPETVTTKVTTDDSRWGFVRYGRRKSRDERPKQREAGQRGGQSVGQAGEERDDRRTERSDAKVSNAADDAGDIAMSRIFMTFGARAHRTDNRGGIDARVAEERKWNGHQRACTDDRPRRDIEPRAAKNMDRSGQLRERKQQQRQPQTHQRCKGKAWDVNSGLATIRSGPCTPRFVPGSATTTPASSASA